MNSMSHVQYLLHLNRADFNIVKRAVNTLLRAGVDFDTAASIVLEAHQARRAGRHQGPAAIYK